MNEHVNDSPNKWLREWRKGKGRDVKGHLVLFWHVGLKVSSFHTCLRITYSALILVIPKSLGGTLLIFLYPNIHLSEALVSKPPRECYTPPDPQPEFSMALSPLHHPRGSQSQLFEMTKWKSDDFCHPLTARFKVYQRFGLFLQESQNSLTWPTRHYLIWPPMPSSG